MRLWLNIRSTLRVVALDLPSVFGHAPYVARVPPVPVLRSERARLAVPATLVRVLADQCVGESGVLNHELLERVHALLDSSATLVPLPDDPTARRTGFPIWKDLSTYRDRMPRDPDELSELARLLSRDLHELSDEELIAAARASGELHRAGPERTGRLLAELYRRDQLSWPKIAELTGI
ncbi:hypothetical protein, partial [Pseudonocardia asaccharolytica]